MFCFRNDYCIESNNYKMTLPSNNPPRCKTKFHHIPKQEQASKNAPSNASFKFPFPVVHTLSGPTTYAAAATALCVATAGWARFSAG